MKPILRRTLVSLDVRNFRLFIFGQTISLCGTWMQTIALSWLVLEMTHSGTELGLVIAAQFIPILFLGIWGGVIVDRFSKRNLLYITQTVYGLLALLLGILVITHAIQLWMIFVIAICIGLVQVVDAPARQSFVIEMVGPDKLKNAISLNSTMVSAARVIGPSFAGIIIATASVGICFIVNSLTFVAVIIALIAMRRSELHTPAVVKKEPGQIVAGLRYIWAEPNLRTTLIMMFIIGTFAYEFPVIFPLFATVTLHGNASTYSTMMVASGVGAIIGGLYTASNTSTRENQLIWSALLFGLSMLLASIMPNIVSVLIVLIVVGMMSITFIALGNTTLQLTSHPSMRGRVMSLWAIAFVGTTPIGGPIIGYISDHTNPRIGLAVGGLSAVIASAFGFYVYNNKLKLLRQKSV